MRERKRNNEINERKCARANEDKGKTSSSIIFANSKVRENTRSSLLRVKKINCVKSKKHGRENTRSMRVRTSVLRLLNVGSLNRKKKRD